MEQVVIEVAAKALKTTTEEVVKHSKKIEGVNAYYFWQPVRGGVAVIVSPDGQKLGATSSVSFEKHLEAFQKGKRN